MCLGSTPKAPDPLPPPQLAEVADVEESGALKRGSERRDALLIKGRKAPTGAASTGAGV